MKRLVLIAAAAALAAATFTGPAAAFCGFYVAKADARLFNKASKVIVARKGRRTVVTMASDYQGDPKEFALVIPVPTVVTKDQINITENALVDHLDAYSAPRLVEYHDPDPCGARVSSNRWRNKLASAKPMLSANRPRRGRAKALGVTIEAQYTVGEYDIVILSAKQSDGLAIWLTESGYRIPPGAAKVLGSYIRQGMKFFVAKVNLKEQAKHGGQYLRPIQVAYETRKFMLPIRLGTVNANGPQDLLIFMLTERGRVETTNYRTVKIPSNQNVPIFTKNEFGKFYKAMFAHQVKKDGMRNVYLEYAWNMGWCDPCAAAPIPNAKLVELGAFWLQTSTGEFALQPRRRGRRFRRGRPQNAYITRLHLRYDAATFPEDLIFQETADRSNFQGRYILRHPYSGPAGCAAGDRYQQSLPARFAKEARNMASLTGWDLATIRQKMAAAGQSFDANAIETDKNWYQRMWQTKP